MREFTWPVRVYYEDTDSGGVVYYANYLKFMERARTEWLRSLGYEQDRLMAEQKVIFVVRRVEADYLRPARFNDELRVKSSIQEQRRTSFTCRQSIIHHPSGNLLCEGLVRVACIDTQTFKPKAIPHPIIRDLTDAV